jgi:CubicO group peptidase (beta-lactamase class C family)
VAVSGRFVAETMTVVAPLVVALAFALQAQAAAPAPRECPAKGLPRVDQYLEPLIMSGEISGTLLVARGDCVVMEKSYGMSDRRRNIENTPTTLYAIASITKPFTDIILDHLVQQRRLAMSDTLSKWIPDFPRGATITIEELRTHRAGIPHRVTNSGDELQPHSAVDMVRLAEHHPLLFTPGTQESYSSAGYSILARVLELASGKSYARLLHDFVFGPAGDLESLDATEPLPEQRVAHSYFRGPTGLLEAPQRDLSFLVGAGSVYSTPSALFKIVRAFVNGVYGSAAADSAREHGSLTWTGATNSYAAFATYDYKADITVIFTANVSSGAFAFLQRDVAVIADGGSAPTPIVPEVRPYRMSKTERARLEGSYSASRFETAVLHFITPSLAELGEAHLIATSDSTFFSAESYSTVRVQVAPDGNVSGLQWQYGPTTLVLERVPRPSTR